MRFILFFFFLFILNVNSYSQFHIKFVVIDSLSKTGIPFATIQNLNEQSGTYTKNDGTGSFEVNKTENNIKVSCLGYQTKIVSLKSTNTNSVDTILLIPQIEDLNQVTVVNLNWNDYKEKNIGFANKKSNLHIVGYPGQEFAVYIPNEKKMTNAIIYEIQCKLKCIKVDSVAFRLHLYSIASDTTPEIELLDSNFIQIIGNQVNDIFAFNISSYKIQLPMNGVYVGFEWLGKYTNNTIVQEKATEPMIGFNFKSSKQLTYERIFSGKWKKSDVRKLFSNLPESSPIFNKNIPNPSIGLKIKYK